MQVIQVEGSTGSTEVIWQSSCVGETATAHSIVFFEGDQIDDDDTRDSLGRERWAPESHLATMRSVFGPEPAVLVIKPTTVSSGGQACYTNFLPALTATGEPLGFRPQTYPAATHLTRILEVCGGRPVGTPCGGLDAWGPGGLVLVGFSKGAVVVNQLLAEIAWQEEAMAAVTAAAAAVTDGLQGASSLSGALASGFANRAVDVNVAAQGPPHNGPETKTLTNAAVGTAHLSTAATASNTTSGSSVVMVGVRQLPRAAVAQPPAAHVATMLDAVQEVHFLDAGLNCRGVHLTDSAVITQLGYRHVRQPLRLHLHGSPRQWGDRRRPWIAAERDRFVVLLQQAGVPVRVHAYFVGHPPSLRQHFDIIGAMELV